MRPIDQADGAEAINLLLYRLARLQMWLDRMLAALSEQAVQRVLVRLGLEEA